MMQPEPMRARSRTWAWFQMREPGPMVPSGETSAVGWMRTSARSTMGSPWGAPILVCPPPGVRVVGGPDALPLAEVEDDEQPLRRRGVEGRAHECGLGQCVRI